MPAFDWYHHDPSKKEAANVWVGTDLAVAQVTTLSHTHLFETQVRQIQCLQATIKTAYSPCSHVHLLLITCYYLYRKTNTSCYEFLQEVHLTPHKLQVLLLSTSYLQEGQVFTDIVGSAYYVAPEVLRRSYGKVCSCMTVKKYSGS
eukprot:1157570-Pelagomonas_calceolata.AAC.7